MNKKNMKFNSNKKDDKYDVLVIGAGNGGLIAATTCASKGLKTLLIEQHNIPGGFASSFVRGRFEFEPALHELGNVGSENEKGDVRQCFDELGISVDWNLINESFTILIPQKDGSQKIYKMPYGCEEFAIACDKIEKGSYKKVKKFIDICENCYMAARYLREARGNPDPEIMKTKYTNYLTVANSTLDDVLKKLRMPKTVKFIIEAYWLYLGTTPKEVSASLYSIMFYEYIKFGPYIPEMRSHEISQAIANRFEGLGGKIWYNTKAEKIDVENGVVVGCKTSRGYIKTNHIISNASPHIVYGDLIEGSQIPNIDRNITGVRKPGSQGFCVYLGLDISAEKLGLRDYSYFVMNSFDNQEIRKNMEDLEKNNSYIVVVQNNGCKSASEKGTCIISFTTLYEDAWNNIKEEEYFKIKNKLAKRFISDFEEKMNIDIMSHIEEIEVATPVTFARYTGSKNGSIYGYKCFPWDSPYVRSRNMDNFFTIKGLRFCGGNSFVSHGYSITYISGNISGNKTFGDIKAEGKGE